MKKVVQGVNKEVYAFDSIGVCSSFNQFETLKAVNKSTVPMLLYTHNTSQIFYQKNKSTAFLRSFLINTIAINLI